jgi:hypothetical protein
MRMPSNDPFSFHQPFDDPDEIATHGAADAAIVHFKNLFLRIDDQVVVDADLAELIDDDGISLGMFFGEDAVEQRRFSRAEKVVRTVTGTAEFIITLLLLNKIGTLTPHQGFKHSDNLRPT